MVRKLLFVAAAAILSGCNSTININNPPASTLMVESVNIASSFLNSGDSDEFYICGNRNEEISVKATYSGSLSSFSIELVGVLNSNEKLTYPTQFLSTEEGDTTFQVTRRLSIKTTDIIPSNTKDVSIKAVTVTPVLIPPQTGTSLGLGAFYAQVKFVGADGSSITKKSKGIVRVLGSSNFKCNPPVVVTPKISSVSISSRFVNNANSSEFFICGNRNEEASVAVSYSGSFDSFTIDLVGELNPSAKLSYGPFSFNSASEGDTSGTVIRRLLIKTTDIKPTDAGRVTTQAVIVTPTPIPPQPSTGLGAFFAEVKMTNSAGTTTVKSAGVIRVLGNNNSQCQ